MNPWLETIGVSLLAVLGGFMGFRCSKLPKQYWLLGYFIPLILVIAIGLTRYIPGLEFMPPFTWLVAGRTEYVLTGMLAAMMLCTPLSRIPQLRTRRVVLVFMVILIATIVGELFLGPALILRQMQQLQTRVDENGVCLQGTDYNCGPAAAVTALRKLNLPAEEGPIAIRAHTSPIAGTQPDDLMNAVREMFETQGVSLQYKNFKNLQELKTAGLSIAVIKFGFLVDHYVTVFDVTDKEVILGDPLSGRRVLDHQEFLDIWRNCGITLERNGLPGKL